ncbi:glycoside hydrolase family 3 C-terminal domain-containing protein [Kitasatospora sp. NPDC094019]|uniref:glycoside hydrolase family 3 C-terminal domain-containing protein n=1 Tax=Kitasatospora sp. NPDC094019 TaxID=3364091 RepID=UPI00382F2181
MADTPARPEPGNLSLEQKASLTSGADFWHLQDLPGAGIESAMVTDGPHGLRKQPAEADPIGIGTSLPATCFPPAVTLAASWDPDLVQRIGEALGREARAEQVSVLLGPGVNIKRSPLCGRNFEYFSEDPLLAGRIGAAFVRGVQSQGVGTSLKHFAANNQESDRFRVSAEVDERTLREIYLPAFEHIVKNAQPYTVMCAYNRINGTHASEHRRLLTEVLREEWGFEGLLVSDWGAVNDKVASHAAGLDVEMPPTGRDHLVVEAVQDGRLDEDLLDASVRRLLALLDATRDARSGRHPAPDLDAHHALAREAATCGAVLLKNDDDLLPLAEAAGQRIAVIGEFARTPRFQGGGSSHVIPTRTDDALTAITAAAGPGNVAFAPGFTLDGRPDQALVDEAVAAARDADIAVLLLGLPASAESEGYDREHIDLPADQLALLAAVHAANPATVVVLSNGSVVSVAEWHHHAQSLLEGWLLGQAGGSAVADILFGRAEPAGRLTETIPLFLADTPAHLHFPGGEQHVRYAEGLYVGYRHYDTTGQAVAYPFGHGLGYSTFALTALSVEPVGDNAFDVSAEVTNTGARPGSQVVQVYVHDTESSVDRPEHELKGFAKVSLEPGESRRVSIHLDERAFAYWSVLENRWKIEAGETEIRVGTSSRDLPLRHRAHLAGNPVAGELDAMSTVADWLDDPTGAQLLAPLLAQHTTADREITPQMRKVMAELPLNKLATFMSVPMGRLDDLVRARRELADNAAPTA